MSRQTVNAICKTFPGAEVSDPWGGGHDAWKVGGKMFCLTSLKEWEKGTPSLNLKCDPEKAEELRAEYEAINPGYHMSKIHWNTVDFHGDVSTKLMFELINHSYDLVFKSLTKKIQNEILDLEN